MVACSQTYKDNPYSPFATSGEYKYIQGGIEKKNLKKYYDNMLKEEHTALHFPTLKDGDRIQKLVATMPDDYSPRQWELHTPEDMKSNDNQQRSIKYWSLNIIKSMR